MNKRLAGALIAAVTATGGCSSYFSPDAKKSNPAPCPNVLVLEDAARLLEFDGEETLENVAYTGEITSVEIGCRYLDDKPIDAEIAVDMAFGKGPKGSDGEKYFKYFVAVTRTDVEVIARQEFVVPITFNEKRIIVVTEEDIDKITIPRRDEEVSGANFEIIVGFVLTPQQAIFNRSGKSLKFPDLQ